MGAGSDRANARLRRVLRHEEATSSVAWGKRPHGCKEADLWRTQADRYQRQLARMFFELQAVKLRLRHL
jgi:hypothetical protein